MFFYIPGVLKKWSNLVVMNLHKQQEYQFTSLPVTTKIIIVSIASNFNASYAAKYTHYVSNVFTRIKVLYMNLLLTLYYYFEQVIIVKSSNVKNVNVCGLIQVQYVDFN